jgi:hypothetical protein
MRRTYRHHGQRRASAHRNVTRRCASQHIATQRLSRGGNPAARARLARTVPLKRLWLRDAYRSQPKAERRSDNEGAS